MLILFACRCSSNNLFFCNSHGASLVPSCIEAAEVPDDVLIPQPRLRVGREHHFNAVLLLVALSHHGDEGDVYCCDNNGAGALGDGTASSGNANANANE